MIFDRCPLPPGRRRRCMTWRACSPTVAGPAEPGELAGEATALAAFARLASPVGISPAASRPARRRLPGRPRRARLPMAAALVAAAAGLGSIAAAYVGVLPTPMQHLAHVGMGAPAPDHGDVAGTVWPYQYAFARDDPWPPAPPARPRPSRPRTWSRRARARPRRWPAKPAARQRTEIVIPPNP